MDIILKDITLQCFEIKDIKKTRSVVLKVTSQQNSASEQRDKNNKGK